MKIYPMRRKVMLHLDQWILCKKNKIKFNKLSSNWLNVFWLNLVMVLNILENEFWNIELESKLILLKINSIGLF